MPIARQSERPLCKRALVLPRRKGVACTLACMGPNRGLSMNDVGLASTNEAWSHLAMIRSMGDETGGMWALQTRFGVWELERSR